MKAEKRWHFQSIENFEIGILLDYRHLKIRKIRKTDT
jgi:hypothetical protein